MTRLIAAAAIAVLLTVPQGVAAQAPPPSAEDHLRECRVYAAAAVTARTRQEIEAAQAIAARDKRIEQLERALAEATKPKEGK